MNNTIQTDIAIIGGGIAGLWLLNRLRDQGFCAILFESDAIGAGQTGVAQGIIHGGMKYALQGKITGATEAISDMPTVWKNCLAGNGEMDLSHVSILSKKQYLWSHGTLTGMLAGFFAGLALKSQLTALEPHAFPDIFKNPQFKGQVYELDEIVLDVQTLLKELTKRHQEFIFKIEPNKQSVQMNAKGLIETFHIQSNTATVDIQAQKYIFTAGVANAELINHAVPMQKRPLHMTVVKHDFPYPVYAHCLGISSTPRMTITTHRAADGKYVWYLGGQIAEEGVKRSAKDQIQITKKELAALFPWLDFSNALFASFLIDRAEGLQSDGRRPDSFYLKEIKNYIVAWPTKLALAPSLANAILDCLQKVNFQPKKQELSALKEWPHPAIKKPIWDKLF